MANRYWVGGGSSNSWDAIGPTNWSDVNGGTNNFSVPGPSDNVFFTTSGNTASVVSNPITVTNVTFASGYTANTTLNATLRVTDTLYFQPGSGSLNILGTAGFDVNKLLDERNNRTPRFSTSPTAIYRIRESFIANKAGCGTTNPLVYANIVGELNYVKFSIDKDAYCDTVIRFYNTDASLGRTINQLTRGELTPVNCINVTHFWMPKTISNSGVS